MSTQFFKIRNTKSGLHSKGGADAWLSDNGSHWAKLGKTWQGSGPLRNHLSYVIEVHGSIPDHWEVIEMEMVEKSRKPAGECVSSAALVKLLKK